MKDRRQLGMSVIEVVLAAAIFVIFASSAVRSLLQNYNANRTGAEYTVASQFASEGLEAVRSIKNQGFSNLVNTAGCGVVRTSAVWAFQTVCTNNTLAHSSSDNFIRTIKVEDVSRSGVPPLGNIISPGGTPDLNTKKITSTVTWNFSSGRPETMSLVTYLSDWKKQIAGNGLIIYGDTTAVTLPQYRLFTDSTNTFGAEAAVNVTADTIVGKSFKVKTSPIRQEAIVGYVNNSGVLRVLCFDGNRWTSEFSVTVGGTGTNDQRFGLAYETATGDALIIYSRNVATTNEMGYRTKPGTSGCGSANWTGETPLDAVKTTGIVHWIRMEANPLAASNNIAVAWADANSDLSAMQWTGNGFTIAEPASALETNLERVSASQDIQSFDIAFESLTGNLMVVWGLSQATTCTAQATDTTATLATNCIRYARYTNAWGVARVIPVVADPATTIDISANPNSDELIVASTDNSQNDLSAAYWSGTIWTGFANVDTTTASPVAGSKLVTTGWLINGATTRAIVVYNNAAATVVSYRVLAAPGTWTPAIGSEPTTFSPTPVFANPQSWYDIQMDPLSKDRLMLSVVDNAADLTAKRLVMSAVPAFTWTNSNGASALEANLSQATTGPYGFAYWRSSQ